MNDQRMVDVGLLRPFVALLQAHNDQGDDSRPVFAINDALITLGDLRKLRAIINGPGVEPVVTDEMVRAYLGANRAYWFEYDKLEPPIGKWCAGTAEEATRVSLLAALRLYLAAPSAPVAKCAECGKQASDGWALYCVECAGKVAPVQAVPDGYVLVKTDLPVQNIAMFKYYPDDNLFMIDGREWKLVPKEPTPEMVSAAIDAHDSKHLSDWGKIFPATDEEIYRAMLAAAPQPPKELTAQSVACPTDKEKSMEPTIDVEPDAGARHERS